MFSKREILFLIIIIIFITCLIKSENKVENKVENFAHESNNKLKEKITYGLKIIDDIFNKNNIYYTIAYGTLLGAVRHWDMIPWDDDADITILRKDVNKVMNLKSEFKKHGLILESDWKLIKVYFDDTQFPFIDIFIYDDENDKIVRCHEPYDDKCNQIDKINNWWWDWINYPSEWIIPRKRFKFGNIEVWGPKEAEKILKFWYGNDCLTKCQTAILDHITGDQNEPDDIGCGILPTPQL